MTIPQWANVMQKFLALLLLGLVLGLSPTVVQADGELSRAETRLSTTVMPAVAWENVPLRDVVRQIAREARVSILTDNRHIDANKSVTLEVANLSSLNVLELVLLHTGYVRQMRNGVIWVTSKERAEANPRTMSRTYDVRDITMPIQDFPAPEMGLGERIPAGRPPVREEPTSIDDLIDLIQNQVTPDKWETNGFSIRQFKGTLIISATAEAHRAIRRLLAQL
jgi:hypothetical protein